MRKSGTVFLLFAVILAGAAGVLASQALKRFNETAPVVVALKTIEPYTQVSLTDVKVQEVPLASVPSDAIVDTKDIVGKFVRDRILQGEILRKARIADTDPGKSVLAARLSELNRPDLRAFALPFTSETGLAGQVKPGDRVDIIASVRMQAGQTNVGVGKIVAANVLVLDVKSSGGSGAQDQGALILALTPQQIEDIAFALTSGQIRFALNPFNTDETAAHTTGVTSEDWLSKYGFTVEGR